MSVKQKINILEKLYDILVILVDFCEGIEIFKKWERGKQGERGTREKTGIKIPMEDKTKDKREGTNHHIST